MFDFLGLPTEEEVPLLNQEEEKQRWQSRRKKTLFIPPKPIQKVEDDDEVDAHRPVRRLPRKLPKKPVVQMIWDSSASALVSLSMGRTLIIFSNTAYCLHIFMFSTCCYFKLDFCVKSSNIEFFLNSFFSSSIMLIIQHTCLNLTVKFSSDKYSFCNFILSIQVPIFIYKNILYRGFFLPFYTWECMALLHLEFARGHRNKHSF